MILDDILDGAFRVVVFAAVLVLAYHAVPVLLGLVR